MGDFLDFLIGGGKKDAPIVNTAPVEETKDAAKQAKKAKAAIRATAGGAVGEEVSAVGAAGGQRIFGN